MKKFWEKVKGAFDLYIFFMILAVNGIGAMFLMVFTKDK